VACGSGVGFVVNLYDAQRDGDNPLRVWDAEELPEVETSDGGAPDLNSIVNISLQCKQYEGPDYKFIETCRSVPDNSANWVVEVKGKGESQSFDFGRSANILMDWNADSVNLLDRSTSVVLVERVTEMTVTIR